MADILSDMKKAGYEPKENTNEFAPVKGSYICRIDSAGRLQGNSKASGEPYDFRTINMQVAEVVGGDKATNRYLKLMYNPDERGVTRLMDDLFTAQIDTKAVNSDTELDSFLETLKDKTMCISAWKAPKMRKEGEEWVEVEPKEYVQKLKVLKEFKNKGNPGTAKSGVPF